MHVVSRSFVAIELFWLAPREGRRTKRKGLVSQVHLAARGARRAYDLSRQRTIKCAAPLGSSAQARWFLLLAFPLPSLRTIIGGDSAGCRHSPCADPNGRLIFSLLASPIRQIIRLTAASPPTGTTQLLEFLHGANLEKSMASDRAGSPVALGLVAGRINLVGGQIKCVGKPAAVSPLPAWPRPNKWPAK